MFEQRKRRKAIERAAPLTVDTPDGSEACVTGIVRVLHKRMFAPASGPIAVAYAIDVLDNAPMSPAAGNQFQTVDACAFAIEGDCGTVIVDSIFVELVDVDSTRIGRTALRVRTRGGQATGHRVGMVERRVSRPGRRGGATGRAPSRSSATSIIRC